MKTCKAEFSRIFILNAVARKRSWLDRVLAHLSMQRPMHASASICVAAKRINHSCWKVNRPDIKQGIKAQV